MASNNTVDSVVSQDVPEAEARQATDPRPADLLLPHEPSRQCEVDDSVVASFPVFGTKVLHAQNHGMSLWGKTAKVTVQMPSGDENRYFLKVVKLGITGKHMCEGEYESLKAFHSVSPGFVPEPYAWGRYVQPDPETYFLLTEFRDVGKQPASPAKLAAGLANLHKNSVSPTGKFGFSMSTCHARVAQAVDTWEESWCTLYTKHLGHFMSLAKPILQWPEFNIVCDLTLEKVVPRLLLPLQSDGRTLKPCLVHGDCWDGNTALDQRTKDAFVFDVCSFYGHNEHDIGNWRAPRHRVSRAAYLKEYKSRFQVSPPEEDWDDRNLLYSLTFNIGNTIYIPGSTQRQVVYDDMTMLCKKFCPEALKRALDSIGSDDSERRRSSGAAEPKTGVQRAETFSNEDEEEEEEEP